MAKRAIIAIVAEKTRKKNGLFTNLDDLAIVVVPVFYRIVGFFSYIVEEYHQGLHR